VVRVQGPSLAEAAAGGLGKALIFAESKGRRYVKRWAKPANPNTVYQIAMRAMEAFLSAAWNTMTIGMQNTWLTKQEPGALPAYNWFLRINLERWRSLKGPSAFYPPAETGTYSTWSAYTPTLQGRRVQLHINVTTLADQWAHVVYAQNSSFTTGAWHRLIHVWRTPTTGHYYFDHLKVPPGTWYYRSACVTREGKLGTSYAIGNITVP